MRTNYRPACRLLGRRTLTPAAKGIVHSLVGVTTDDRDGGHLRLVAQEPAFTGMPPHVDQKVCERANLEAIRDASQEITRGYIA